VAVPADTAIPDKRLKSSASRKYVIVLIAAVFSIVAVLAPLTILQGRGIGSVTRQEAPVGSLAGSGVLRGVEVGPYEGLTAPDFTAKTIDGRIVNLSDLRGRIVVLWFMATWCPSCSLAGPQIKSAVDKLGEADVTVVAIDVWSSEVLEKSGLYGRPGMPPPDDSGALLKFISRIGGKSWKLILDDGSLSTLYGLVYIDTVFVIGRDGKVLLRSDVPVTADIIERVASQAPDLNYPRSVGRSSSCPLCPGSG